MGTAFCAQHPAPAREAAPADRPWHASPLHTPIPPLPPTPAQPRTEAYRDALEGNPSLLRGARVLDVGCGTAILSMFAARGGAASVVGIDGSAAIARFAQANVEANGLAASAGGPITVVSSKVEELAALPPPASTAGAAGAAGEQQAGQPQVLQAQQGAAQQAQQAQQVDVLVSEWMGYALLFESMLDSVLHARDRWLRPGGALLPDVARVYVAAASEAAAGLDFWRDVYGFRCVDGEGGGEGGGGASAGCVGTIATLAASLPTAFCSATSCWATPPGCQASCCLAL